MLTSLLFIYRNIYIFTALYFYLLVSHTFIYINNLFLKMFMYCLYINIYLLYFLLVAYLYFVSLYEYLFILFCLYF